MTITVLPTPPSRGMSADDFIAAADAWNAALAQFGLDINAFSANLLGGFAGTSVSSVLIGTGAKSFTTQLGLAFQPGQPIVAASVSGPTNQIVGTVTSYNASTGVLVMNAASVGGSGTKTDWAISLVPAGGSTLGSALYTAADAPTARALLGISLRNRVHNPDAEVYQRAAASTADDAYTGMWDRWYALTQTAAITPSQLTDVGAGTPFMGRLTQAQASAQRMGASQIIEAQNCKDLRGQTVAFSARIRSSLSQAIRYAILEWTGTADAVTSDVVNSWTNATFTAGQFFASTTLNVLAVGVVTPTAATLTDLPAITATVGASANNLIVMIWSEGTLAQNATLDIAQAQLAPGTSAASYAPRDAAEELRLCQRFYSVFRNEWRASAASGGIYRNLIPLPVSMRATPTIAAITAGTATNLSGTVEGALDNQNVYGELTSSAGGNTSIAGRILSASADL